MKNIYPHLFESGENADKGTKFPSYHSIRLCVSMSFLTIVVEY